MFLLVAGAVFVVHAFNAMHSYYPRWPEFPLEYNLTRLMADPPLKFAEGGLKRASVYFVIIGVTYFVQTRVAFSLWVFFVIHCIAAMVAGAAGSEITPQMKGDQNFGATLVFALMILWVGRGHWAMVIRQMLGRHRADEDRGQYLSNRTAGWSALICAAVVIAWLCVAGMTVFGAAVLVGMILLVLLVIGRVVAETGLCFVQLLTVPAAPWQLAEVFGVRTTSQNMFVTHWWNILFAHDLRENLAVYSTHALKTADGTGGTQFDRRSTGAALIVALGLALVTGYIVSGWSTLRAEYQYAETLDVQQERVNKYASVSATRKIADDTVAYANPSKRAQASHSRLGHVTFGAVLTGVLSALRLRYSGWPLHPVGYLLSATFPMNAIWFSVFLGWLAKTAIVKYGGSTLYRASRNAFLGMIVGECCAAAFWLSVSLVRLWLHLDYHAIRLLPT
jgi:hypothetical protein